VTSPRRETSQGGGGVGKKRRGPSLHRAKKTTNGKGNFKIRDLGMLKLKRGEKHFRRSMKGKYGESGEEQGKEKRRLKTLRSSSLR